MVDDRRPAITAGALSEILDRLAPRIRRRLDADPVIAESWAWVYEAERVKVRAGDANVTLPPGPQPISSASAAACDCLLAPACVHVAAVVSRLSLSDGVTTVDASAEGSEAEVTASTPEILAAAAAVTSALGRLLEVGAASAGTLAQADILRAVHTCQLLGLHRLAAAGLRVGRGLALLAAGEPEFVLGDLVRDVSEGLAVARRVVRGDLGSDTVGRARRAYESVGSLRLYGLFSEPVIARSGFAGCTTYLADASGRLWSVSDIQPGPPERAVFAHDAPIGIGDSILTHREAARGGLLLGNATASEDGRLGRGQRVRAVSASGVAWDEAPVASLFAPPLEQQLDRVWQANDQPDSERRQGSLLVFVRGAVVGKDRDAVVVSVGDTQMRFVSPDDNEQLAYRSNLEALGGWAGAKLLFIARPLRERPATLELLACGTSSAGATDAPSPTLPASLTGRASLGLDTLPRIVGGTRRTVDTPHRRRPAIDPLIPLERRLDRLVLGGRLTLGDPAASAVAAEAGMLRRRQLGTAADALLGLSLTARARGGSDDLAMAWLAADIYRRAARRIFATTAWRTSAISPP